MTHARRLTDSVYLPGGGGRIVVALFTALALAAGAVSWSRWESDPHRWLFSYLVAWTFLVTIGVGSLAWLMLQHLTRAVWSIVVRRLLENIALALPLLAVGFVPIARNLQRIYAWADASRVAADPALGARRPGLTPCSSACVQPFTWGSGPFSPPCWEAARRARTEHLTRARSSACGG